MVIEFKLTMGFLVLGREGMLKDAGDTSLSYVIAPERGKKVCCINCVMNSAGCVRHLS